MPNKENQRSKQDRNFRRWLTIILACCTILVIAGYIGMQNMRAFMKTDEAEEQVWQQCIEKDTYNVYSRYIIAYPEGKHNKEAIERMEELGN